MPFGVRRGSCPGRIPLSDSDLPLPAHNKRRLQRCITVRARAIMGCTCGLNSNLPRLDFSLQLLLQECPLITGFACGSQRCITLRTFAIPSILGCLCRLNSCLPRLDFGL